LRRLADRFGAEVCLAICAGQDVPGWVREALPTLPDIMHASDQRASKADRTCIDQTEIWTLAGRVGETFDAVVVHSDDKGGEVMLLDPPVIARCAGAGLREGERTTVELVAVDQQHRQLSLTYRGAGQAR
jgi:exoribonuclease R